eukprot:TRINITY_DN12170_c0_g1_i1.p1 TRINITY_DN12170_c0_g1~~TRINITY_DN12170_c0_g1_i1.p1  ORF type:complete len:358 (+),score=104.20 TRINITY_DN12170_c0_g1_i1:69-1076(+)
MAAAAGAPGGGVTAVLGTMTFGWKQASAEVDDAAAKAQIEFFVSKGYCEVDTARMYAGGETENILGRVLKDDSLCSRVKVATKAKPYPTGTSGSGGLVPAELRAQVQQSLAALQMPSVDLLYLHAPDVATPIEDTLAAVAELHAEGKFRRLGLSNYQSWEVAHIYHLCKSRGWVTPSVYQGMYNACTREVERELFPCLRALGMQFLAYNPLAAGVLTGKYKHAAPPTEGRFKDNKTYMDRYWKPAYMSLEAVQGACEEVGLSMTAAALRWLKHHSGLAPGDGIILGASKIEHLNENIEALEGGPLPGAIVAAFDKAWEACRPECPSYERGHSKYN